MSYISTEDDGVASTTGELVTEKLTLTQLIIMLITEMLERKSDEINANIKVSDDVFINLNAVVTKITEEQYNVT